MRNFSNNFIATSFGDIRTFETMLTSALECGVSEMELNILDDELELLFSTAPDLAEKYSIIAASLYQTGGREIAHGLAMNTLFAHYMRTGRTGLAQQALMKTVKYAITRNHHAIGCAIVGTAENALKTTLINQDGLPAFISLIVDFYVHFADFPAAIDAYCAAALVFGRNGAFQSAYRVINNAQLLAMHNNLFKKQAEILFTQSVVASDEPDLACAEKDLQTAIDLLNHNYVAVPQCYLTNLGTIKMRQGKYTEASVVFQDAAMHIHSDVTVKAQSLINLAVCYREIGRLSESRETIRAARAITSEWTRSGITIELELVECKLALATSDVTQAGLCLNNALRQLDAELMDLHRLHFRRGLREQYIQRLENIVCAFPAMGDVSSVIAALSFIRRNNLSDWLCVLDWCDLRLSETTLDGSIVKLLRERLDALISFGTPVLYGYREKYDDPFEKFPAHIASLDYSTRWEEFKAVIREVAVVTNTETPFAVPNRVTCSRSRGIICLLFYN